VRAVRFGAVDAGGIGFEFRRHLVRLRCESNAGSGRERMWFAGSGWEGWGKRWKKGVRRQKSGVRMKSQWSGLGAESGFRPLRWRKRSRRKRSLVTAPSRLGFP
jgi:hypothetical protein